MTAGALAMIFTRHEDGTITVNDWTRKVVFSKEFLNYGITNNAAGVKADYLHNTVTITCANGRAVYQLDVPNPAQTWRGVLVEAELDL